MSNFKDIWGIKVPITRAGRISWPNELKKMAVEKVLDHGVRNALVAEEIGAHDNLVRKWCIQERRVRGEDVSSQPTFAPVNFSDRPHAMSLMTSAQAQMCRLSVGQAVLEFPSDMSLENLQAMIQAMKGTL